MIPDCSAVKPATDLPAYVILISGRGSNMEALLAADLPGRCAAVIANRPDAAGLAFAQARQIPVAVVDHRQFARREDFDAALAAEIARYQPQWIFLAGFMRVLGPAFVAYHAGRLINIHPSLLPAFPGLHTHRAALSAGAKVHGCTIHVVTATLDCGPIIAQAAVPVRPDDDAETLAARVLEQEHIMYPRVARWLLQGRVRFSEAGNAEVLAPDWPQGLSDALRVPGG